MLAAGRVAAARVVSPAVVTLGAASSIVSAMVFSAVFAVPIPVTNRNGCRSLTQPFSSIMLGRNRK